MTVLATFLASVVAVGSSAADSTASERAMSRFAFRAQPRDQALATARRHHAASISAAVWAPLARARVERYLGPRSALVDTGEARPGLVESLLPLRAPSAGGDLAPVDLSLRAADGRWRSSNPLVDVRVGRRLREGVRFERTGVSVAAAEASADEPQTADDRVFWANAFTDTDVWVTPQPTGFELFAQLRSPDAPERIALEFSLPAGAQLRMAAGGRAAEVIRGDERLTVIEPPAAWDAAGTRVDVGYDLDGSRLSLVVAHRDRDLLYPILVDPYAADGLFYDDGLGLAAESDWGVDGWYPLNSSPEAPWYACAGGLTACFHGGYTHPPGRFMGYAYKAPANTYIYRATFSNVSFAPWGDDAVGRDALIEGIYDPASGSWLNYKWEDWPDGTYAFESRWETTQSQSSDWKMHCMRGNCAPPAGANGNEARAMVVTGHSGYRCCHSSMLYVRGAEIYMDDHEQPWTGEPIHTGLPTGWTSSAEPTVTANITDPGLGVKHALLSVPKDGGGTETVRADHGCAGVYGDRCPQSWTPGITPEDPPRPRLAYDTDTMPEGINTLDLRGQDLVSHFTPTPRTWQVKVDRGAPQLSVTGALRSAEGLELQEGTHSVAVTATDGTPGGSASQQRSGVRKLEILVDGETEESLDVACPEGSCGRSLSWTLDTENYPAGDTPIEVVATDELGHTTREQWAVRIPGEATDDPLEAAAQAAADIPLAGQGVGTVPLGIENEDTYGAEKQRAATELFLPDDLSDPDGGGSDTDGLLGGEVATSVPTPGALEGLSAGISSPPDTTGAIGPNHYVEMVNRQVGVFSRSDLSLVASLDLDDFIGAENDSAFDPQIVWDQRANRWFYVTDRRREIATGTFENFLAFGWSKTADPSDLENGWCQFFVNTGEYLDDYPKLGHSNRHMVIGTNVFPADEPVLGDRTTARIWAIPKPERGVTTCDRPRTFRWPRASNPDTPLNVQGHRVGTPVAAATPASSYNGWVFAADTIQEASAVDTEISVLHVSGPRSRPRLTRDGVLEVPRYRMPPDVPQPATDRTLNSLDARFTQAVAETDPDAGRLSVWAQHTVRGRGGRAAIRWYQFLPRARASGTVRQRGTISDGTHHLFNAAVAPTGNGGAVINYNAGSATLLPEIRARSRTRAAALGRMTGGVLIARSDTANQDYTCFDDRPELGSRQCRWGDYAGASQDPLNDNVVWGANQVIGPRHCANTPVPPLVPCEPTTQAHWKTWIMPLSP